jgi:glutamate dehydrogenase
MISSDPQLRADRLTDLQQALTAQPDPADRELLHAFVAAIFPELPDAFVLRPELPDLAKRIAEAYRFVVHTVPPAIQVYRGAPGLHVQARNPDDEEVTIVETHTPHVPFIFESLKNCFQKQGLRVFSAIHPLFTVRRQWERIARIGDAGGEGARELYCQFRVERFDSRERLRRIEHELHAVLKSVFLAVEDFPAMRRAVQDLGLALRSRHGVQPDADSAKAFLTWLVDDNFVLLGTLGYQRAPRGGLEPAWEASRGVFRDPNLLPVVFPGLMDRFDVYPAPAADDERVIDIDYCTGASAIHHLEPLDAFVIREWAADDTAGADTLKGATLLIGRLAKSALSSRPQDIPLLREKLTWLLEHSGVAARSHVHRATRAVFNQFPKRELLYANAVALKSIIDRMVRLTGDDDVAVSVRRGAGYQAMNVAFSKAHYSHRVEEQLTAELAAEIGAVSFHTWADCGDTALVVFYFHESEVSEIDLERVRQVVGDVITTWEDRTATSLDRVFGPTEGRRLFRRYIRTEDRSGLYREITRPDEVPEDLQRFEQLQERLEIRILPGAAGSATLKLFSPTPLELVDTLRTLEHLGLVVREEVSVPLVLPEGRRGFVQRLRVEAEPAAIERLPRLEGLLLDALRALHEGRATNDPLNGLLLSQGLQWRDIALLRTLRNYLLQIRPQYAADTLTAVLLRNSGVAAGLFRLFAARFDPALDAHRAEVLETCEVELERATSEVASLLHDEILKALENVVRAIVRTNFYQQPERPVVAVKLECRLVQGLPFPRPLFEIYVHSPLLEGVHLRGGRVARGGIRWSDRPDDFRAEILSLMKTQMLKNSIIVPVGSKGGFVLKGALALRSAQENNLTDRYREFISGLLDVTDNRVDNGIEHPPQVVRYDSDDPYLVVAADKGTAHLSDTANEASAQYGFWLGDAFASGGSNGYDHKKEGITARGAWASVEHHFRLIGIDPARQPFTAIGIGDMSGDVFGNGLLQSRMTKLVGAFDHQHIFLDPDPDPETSFRERQRLFALPRSTWRDYDASRLSSGGGVFDRQAKTIPLSTPVRTLLGVDAVTASGEEVIRRLLAAKVDLLYNGGIGTYVKAHDEETATIADRANDRVRVNAADLGARVVAEGGNLGFTEHGRIEYWAKGGLINTDAVDNSGGVSMSDHEVNIKILLDLLMREGKLAGPAERSGLLTSMTDEVSQMVLVDNVQQARALTLDSLRSVARYDDFLLALDHMVLSGAADRGGGLPTREELTARPDRHRGLPRPVLAVAMALAKNWGFGELLKTPVVDGPLARPFLHGYFPSLLRDRFADRLGAHPLRREIVATAIINHLVNHAGISVLPRLMVATGKDAGAIVTAYLTAEQASGAVPLRQKVIDAGGDIEREHELLLQIEDALGSATQALLGGGALPPLSVMDSLRAAVSSS